MKNINDSKKTYRILTVYDVCNALLNGMDCIVGFESAADLLGYTNWGDIKKIHIYTTEQCDNSFLECHIVDSLDNIPYIKHKNIKVSPIENAIIDMLKSDETDDQVLYEIFAKYYYKNNDNYSNLIIPNSLKEKAENFMKEGKLYYES